MSLGLFSCCRFGGQGMELPVSLCHHKPEPHLISARKQVSQTAPGPSVARWMAVRHHEPFPSCTKGAL